MSVRDINPETTQNGNFLGRRPESTAVTPVQQKPFDSNDLFIAVMGVTGSGKSTFISRCTGQQVGIGHGLKSHTSEIEVFSYLYNDKRIHLIDTPGFDDTFRPDIEVLKTAATWLSEAYQKNLLLTGIIYLHRITDARMGGTARKDLTMFKKLCGEDSFSNVVLATTHWEKVSLEDGERREIELRSSTEFYGTMIRRGSTMMRHMDSAVSAKAIVAHLVNQHTTTVLNIQREMVADRVGLKETEAGQVLQSDIIKKTNELNRRLKETEEQMKEAIKQKDDALARELADQAEELSTLKAAAEKGSEQLNVKMEDLFKEKDKKFKKAMQDLEDERKERERIIREKTNEHEIFKAKVKEAEELAERKRKSTEEEIAKAKEELDQATGDNYRLLAAFLQTVMEQEEAEKKAQAEQVARDREELERQKADILKAQVKMQEAMARQARRPEFYQGDPPPYQPFEPQQQAWQGYPPMQGYQQYPQYPQYPQQMYQPNAFQGPDPSLMGMGAVGGMALGAAAMTMCNVM